MYIIIDLFYSRSWKYWDKFLSGLFILWDNNHLFGSSNIIWFHSNTMIQSVDCLSIKTQRFSSSFYNSR